MLRFASGLCGAALILAFGGDTSAQHLPAAWDTRVRSPAASAAEPRDKSAQEQQEQKEKTKKALDAAGGQKKKID
jgi:hypothetical protein